MSEAEREQVGQEPQPPQEPAAEGMTETTTPEPVTPATQAPPSGQETAAPERTEVAVAEAPERPKEPPQGSRSYELIFLVDAALPREELDALIEKVRNYLEREGGVIDNIRVSEVRRLAYEIKKRTHGIYVVFNFHILPNRVAELDRMLRMEERVLRHMVIHTRA